MISEILSQDKLKEHPNPEPIIEQLMASGDDLFCIAGGKMYEYNYGFWKPTEHFQWRID